MLLLLFASLLYGQEISATNVHYISVCNLARILRFYGEHMEDIAHWICIALAESNLKIKKISAGNYGLFQIKSDSWCSRVGKGGLCNVHCDSLKLNTHAQIKCALKVRDNYCYWGAWPSWLAHCHGKKLLSVKQCFKHRSNFTLDGNTTVHAEWQHY